MVLISMVFFSTVILCVPDPNATERECALFGPRVCCFFVAFLFFLLSTRPLRTSCVVPGVFFSLFFSGAFFLLPPPPPLPTPPLFFYSSPLFFSPAVRHSTRRPICLSFSGAGCMDFFFFNVPIGFAYPACSKWRLNHHMLSFIAHLRQSTHG